jgi:hypothetical protein
MNNRNIHLVAFYYAKPKSHVNTSISGWMNDPENIRYDERVEITRGLKKDSAIAKVILDLSDKRVVRNGWNPEAQFNDLFKYYFKGYHQYVTTVMTQLDSEYFNQMLDEMQAELDASKHTSTEPATE